MTNGYTEEAAAKLVEKARALTLQLRILRLDFVMAGESAEGRAKEHLQQGAGRRLGSIARAIERIYEVFPPDALRPPSTQSLEDATLSLHGIFANMAGFFDNCAWAIVFDRNIESLIANPVQLGLFKRSFAKHLPAKLSAYIGEVNKEGWLDDYLKSHRDAMVHRIPPYLPPSAMTAEEGERFNGLERKKFECIRRQDLDALARAEREQASLGRPCFVFLHSYHESENPRPIQLHPQILTDAMTIIDFSKVFLATWRDHAKIT